MNSMLEKLGLKDGESIDHPWINKALERAQQKVEARNFDIRKNLLKYDDVMNLQRKSIFSQRREIMESEFVTETITDMREKVIDNIIWDNISEDSDPTQWETDLLKDQIKEKLGVNIPLQDWIEEDSFSGDEFQERVNVEASKILDDKKQKYGIISL